MNTINFTPDKLRKLKRQYREAAKAGQEQFDFEGNPLLVAYAKYLIEYLESRFAHQPLYTRQGYVRKVEVQ